MTIPPATKTLFTVAATLALAALTAALKLRVKK